MNLKHLAFLSTALIFSQQISAAGKNKADRWFEMEVILFSQLGDKAQLKEQFPENSPLPQYRKIIDLLGPYLNPDITSLKQKLPSCNAPIYPGSLLNQAITALNEQPYYVEKTLNELESEIPESIRDIETSSSVSQFSDGTDTRDISVNNEEDNDLIINSPVVYAENQIAVEQSLALSFEELTQRSILLSQAESEFSSIQLSYSNETASFDEVICTISFEQFNALNQLNNENAFESYTAFNIDKMPSTIHNSGDIYTDNDYLIDKDSLKLHGIVKQLARSKNFRPLLHFGWRQKTKTKRLAVPMKVYAGENFAYHYEQELQQYQQQLEQVQTQEEMLNKALSDNSSSTVVLSEEAFKQQAITARLQELMVKLPDLPTDTNNLLDEIDKDITNTNAALNSKNTFQAPIKPPQDWTIDGFLKVEVDFYLHITADFNVMNMSLAQLATQQLLPLKEENDSARLKTINFKQDRRVRSKEIHYFDHPYMGMIIRILPYRKPIKEVEEPASTN